MYVIWKESTFLVLLIPHLENGNTDSIWVVGKDEVSYYM